MQRLETKFLIALLLPFALIMGGGIWGGLSQHTHRSLGEGGVISWIPTGFVGCYAGPTPPANTLEAYGQAVSRTDYATLFAHIVTTYGVGDGSTTFNLPDLRGRMMIGLDNAGGTPANIVTSAAADTLGGKDGTEIMSIAQMPAHTHRLRASSSGQAGGTDNFGGAFSGSTESTGGGAAFNPPFIALHCVIGT